MKLNKQQVLMIADIAHRYVLDMPVNTLYTSACAWITSTKEVLRKEGYEIIVKRVDGDIIIHEPLELPEED